MKHYQIYELTKYYIEEDSFVVLEPIGKAFTSKVNAEHKADRLSKEHIYDTFTILPIYKHIEQ